MKIVAIVQARMGSTRLPGKVLKEVGNKPLLLYQLERIKRSKLIDQIIVATTNKKEDDLIELFCKDNGYSVYRGSELDVLNRYVAAAKYFEADTIVRLTADCPFIDPAVIDLVIQRFLEHKQDKSLLYVSNTLERTYPRGLDVEVFSYDVLIEADRHARSFSEREHVTKYIVNHPEQFELVNVRQNKDFSHERWTVDTKEDFDMVKKILESLYPQNPNFTMADVVKLLNNYPSWRKINAYIKQKEE